MKRSKYNSFNELPLMLTVQDVADVLGIGRSRQDLCAKLFAGSG